MRNNYRFLAMAGMLSLLAVAPIVACTTEDEDSGDDTSSGGAGSDSGGADNNGGATTSSGGATATQDVVGYCQSPTALGSDQSAILNFDDYDGAAALDGWYVTLPSGILLGPYGYGDGCDDTVTKCLPETIAAPEGYDGTAYSYEVADTEATEFGGGAGVWINGCLDASVFTGLTFAAKGSTPTGKVKVTLRMGDTTVENDDGTGGFCVETSSDPENNPTCVSPSYTISLPDDATTWKEYKIPWASFTGGKGNGEAVTADGSNIVQIQFGIDLNWVPESEGSATYVAVPAPYDFTFDSLAFY